MSKELKGSNGAIVGSSDYFRKLNGYTVIGGALKSVDGYDYHNALKKLATRSYAIFDEIYSDLRKHAGVIRYIPENDRKNLIKMIYGLFDICKMTSSGTGYGDKCISILTLSASETRVKSRASDREIEAAVKIIQNGGSIILNTN